MDARSRFKLASHLSSVVLVAVSCLIFQAPANAFPLLNELRPFGEGAIANGYARKNNESSVFYTETYLDDPMSDMIRAVYWDGNRQPISYKQLDFGNDAKVPDFFEVIDYRRKRGYRITVKDNVANVKVLNVASDGSESVRTNKNVPIDSKTVIDAAFHRFVVANWDKLTQGKTIKINFLQIDKARLVPLKIKLDQCDTPASTCFKISFDNFLLQGVVPNIFMKYETSSKRLIRYTGIGPITRMNGKGLPIDIRYEYLQ